MSKSMTLFERINDVADSTKVPKTTVEVVIKSYLKSIENSLCKGEDVVINGIMSISCRTTPNGQLSLYGRVSDTIKEKVNRG